jgi:uncharacterized membrane protein (UPF0127 family)
MIFARETGERVRLTGYGREVLPLFLFFAALLFPAASSGSGNVPGDGISGGHTREIAIMRQSASTAERRNVIFRLTAEIASDREARRKGLSGRERPAENRGMLFVLDEGEPGAFWMKGMKFPLDLLYFDRHRRLIKILYGLQPCEMCPQYPTPAAAAYVLEIVGGTAARHDITTGSSFAFTGEGPGGRVP